MNVFPEGCKVGKESPAFPSWSLCLWTPAIKGNSLANELGLVEVLVNHLSPRLSSFMAPRPMTRANILRNLFLCSLHLHNLRPRSQEESAEVDLLSPHSDVYMGWGCQWGGALHGIKHPEGFIQGTTLVRENREGTGKGWENHQTALQT